MPDVDLNQKVWGVKAKTHVLIFAGLLILASCICLIAFIDYMSLPSNAPDKAKGELIGLLSPLLFTPPMACIGAALLICLPYKMFYIILAIVLCICAAGGIFWIILFLFVDMPSIFVDEKAEKLRKKYYKCAQVGGKLTLFAGYFLYVYLAIVLFKLGLGKPPPPPPSPRVIVRRCDDDDDEESDRDEERPKSGARKPRTPQKSGKSTNSGTAERSQASGTGRLDKTGRSGEKSGKSGPGKTTEEEILAM